MHNAKMSASVLRVILSIALVLLITADIAGFVFVQKHLAAKATEAAALNEKADSSQSELQNLKDTEKKLNSLSITEEKASEMIATNQHYTYQDQILKSLQEIGNSAHVNVKSIEYASTAPVSGATNAANTPSAPATPAAPVPGNVKPTQASVAIATPVKYTDLLAFLHGIEQNTMSMKVSKIGITATGKDKDGNTMVNCDVLTIGVYIR